MEEEKKALKQKLEEAEKQKAEYLAGWQRTRADFLNYKKEELERIEGFLKYAGEEMILKLLPVLDNFDLAEEKMPESLKQDENVKGVLQLRAQILDFLKFHGVEEIKTEGNKFDPNLHEAAETVENSGAEAGIILEQINKGYKIQGRLLRPARVKVSK